MKIINIAKIIKKNSSSLKIPLIENTTIGIGEMVNIETNDGHVYSGVVYSSGRSSIEIDLLDGYIRSNTAIKNLHFPKKFVSYPFSLSMLGRSFNAAIQPIDGGANPVSDIYLQLDKSNISRTNRQKPHELLQTGIKSIDALIPLFKGQTISIFSPFGVNNQTLITQIMHQIQIDAICYTGIGITPHKRSHIIKKLEEEALTSKSISFFNLNNDPINERVLIPKISLTMAEYLAFKHNMDVLVIFDNLKEYSNAIEKLYKYKNGCDDDRNLCKRHNLKSLYSRSGKIRRRQGSITIISLFDLPSLDLLEFYGSLTDAQIVLDSDLNKKGIYPSIDILSSFSRLIYFSNYGQNLINGLRGLYNAYKRAKISYEHSLKFGEMSLSEIEKEYLQFYFKFNEQFINQDPYENIEITQIKKHLKDFCAIIPKEKITLLKDKQETSPRLETATTHIPQKSYLRESLFSALIINITVHIFQ